MYSVSTSQQISPTNILFSQNVTECSCVVFGDHTHTTSAPAIISSTSAHSQTFPKIEKKEKKKIPGSQQLMDCTVIFVSKCSRVHYYQQCQYFLNFSMLNEQKKVLWLGSTLQRYACVGDLVKSKSSILNEWEWQSVDVQYVSKYQPCD